MEEIIKVEVNDNQEPIVSGRNLHEALGVETRYNDWINRMIEYGFTENVDFELLTQKRVTNNPKNPYTEITDHAIKLDIAKEICMLQRSKKGRLTRKCFIEVEKELNSPEKIMARALKIAENKLNEATNKIKYLEVTNSSLTVDNARMLQIFYSCLSNLFSFLKQIFSYWLIICFCRYETFFVSPLLSFSFAFFSISALYAIALNSF